MEEEEINVGEGKHVNLIKDKLQQVAEEIDTIKSTFSKSTEDLTRIKNMLDVDNLDEISGFIENYETRLLEADRKREEAMKGAQKYSDELEKEKERLIKLWDAYKNQEEELSTTDKKMSDFEEKIRNAEDLKNQLENDLTDRINTLTEKLQENESKITQFDEYKQRCEEFDSIRNRLDEEIRNFKDDVNNKDETISSLQKQVDELKEYEQYTEFKDKYNEVSENYEKEKERLTKLYHLYEESEAECKKLKQESKNWQEWFDSNKDIFERLFSAAPPGNTTMEPPETMSESNTPEENRSKLKKKKKLRLKK